MQEFIHHKVRVIEGFLTEFNQVQQLYAERSFDFDHRFMKLLDTLSDYFKNRGESSKESEVRRIGNLIHTVKRGFDPSKMEKISSGRRELAWGFSYTGIEGLNALLQETYSKEQSKLNEGEEILTNLLLSLYQQGNLSDDTLKGLDSIRKIEIFWGTLLLKNGSISVINKKLRTMLIAEDIHLLMEKVIAKIT